MDLVISNGTVVTMNRDREVLFRAEVLVKDGRIAHVGKGSVASKLPRRVLDASGKVVIPGLIHGHLHACQTLFRSRAEGVPLLEWLRTRIWPLEAAHDPVSMRASADLTFAELIKSGSTAILDMGTVHHTDVIFESASTSGFRLTSGKAMMDLGVGLPHALRETTSESLTESVRLLHRWHGTEQGRLRYAFAPRFALSSSEDLLQQVAQKAKEHQVRIHTHASENARECEEVRQRTGQDNVEYLHSLELTGPDSTLAHCVWLSDSERQILAQTGTSVCHCPSSNFKLSSGLADVPKLLQAGVSVCLGADGAACNNNLDIFTEMRLASLVHKLQTGASGMPAAQVLEMATLAGARALGLESEIGSVEVGKRADLAVVDMSRAHSIPPSEDVVSQLIYSAHSSDVESVIIDGRLVMRDRQLLTLDEERVLRVAREQAKKLAARVA